VIKVSLVDNFSALDKALQLLEKEQMPFAIARALTDMAQVGQKTITREIPEIFSKGGEPKSFTVNSVVAKPATKSTLSAMVFIKDKQAAYLALEETGGTRDPKGTALVLPGSAAADLHDTHGNLPENTLRKLKQAARMTATNGRKARRARAQLAARSRKAGAPPQQAVPLPTETGGIVYFSHHGPHGRGTGGYYERLAGHHLRRLTGFEGHAEYQPIFRYHERIAEAVQPAFAAALMQRLHEAIASAR
jgi:hypothetical protein